MVVCGRGRRERERKRERVKMRKPERKNREEGFAFGLNRLVFVTTHVVANI